MITLTPSGAENLASSISNLYRAMESRFGTEKAWEFIIAFYSEAGGRGR